ncbi:MAG: hypothetical protein ACUVX8_02630 [Candidatus Zipacnadales bacterium]
MLTIYWILLVVGVLSFVTGMVAHFVGPFAMTSSSGFLRFAEACFLLAIAMAVGPLLQKGPGHTQTAPDNQTA